MNRRIIGIGSPFGADQLGWRAIDLLQTELTGCELIKLDRPGSDLIRYFQGLDDVVLIDAVQAGRSPGSARRLEMEDLSNAECQTSSHGFGVADALRMAARLDLLPPQLILIGVETGGDLTSIPDIELEQLAGLL
ncbi:MAG: hydrogenase maturation protease [Pseudomonadota bacterium]